MEDPPGARQVFVDVELGGDLVGVVGLLGACDSLQLEGAHLAQAAVAGDDVTAMADQRWLKEVGLDQARLDLVVGAWIPDANCLVTRPAKGDRLQYPRVGWVRRPLR